jgi:hypothetical protein
VAGVVMDTNYQKVVAHYGSEPINPIGQCFDSAFQQLVYGGEAMNPDGTVLCHGVCVANFPGQEGVIVGHAWLEFNHDGEEGVIDTTWGKIIKKDNYYSQIQVLYKVTYTRDEAAEMNLIQGFSGPWDLQVKNAVESAIKWRESCDTK